MGLTRNASGVRTAGKRLLPKSMVLFWQATKRGSGPRGKNRRRSMVVDRVILGELFPSQAALKLQRQASARCKVLWPKRVWQRWSKFQVRRYHGLNAFAFHGNRPRFGLPEFFRWTTR